MFVKHSVKCVGAVVVDEQILAAGFGTEVYESTYDMHSLYTSLHMNLISLHTPNILAKGRRHIA